jgi:hypothetical protein
VFVMNWLTAPPDMRLELVATYRERADRTDSPTLPVTVESVASQPGQPKDVFVVRRMRAGVYTFVMRYTGGTGTSARPLLYLGRAGQPAAYPLAPMSLSQNGRTVLAKVLAPHGVLWDQDEWFSGRSESSDTITKFRLPEGISWTERKSPVP